MKKESEELGVIRREVIFWKDPKINLPKPETDVLVKFSDGSVNYLWQNWGDTDNPNRIRIDSYGKNIDEDYHVVAWAYVDEEVW